MRTEEDIRGSMELFTACYEQEKRAALTANNVDEAAQHLRKMYDWRIRSEMLTWVLQEPK